MTTLKLGTRGSALALTQSRWIAKEIESNNAGLTVEIQIIKTRGDKDQNSALNKFAGKGIFTKEIEDALLASEIDLAVHSLKDLPTSLPPGLVLADPPRREDPRDLLVSKCPVLELAQGARIGTGSARRREQLRLLRPDLQFQEIRGNVSTRVKKWRDGQCDATVLACAGVERLGKEAAGLTSDEAHPLSLQECVPAACQGILGLEIREGDDKTRQFLSTIACPEAIRACEAERAFLARLGGGCHIPAGAWAREEDGQFKVVGFLALEAPDRSYVGQRLELVGPAEDAVRLGTDVAAGLKKALEAQI